MNRKILTSLILIGLLSLGLGWGTYSYFSDPETSEGNVFQAGTLDLKLWDGGAWANGVSGLIILDKMEPGAESGYIVVKVKNEGSLPGVLSYEITAIVDYDGTKPDDPDITGSVSAEEFAKSLYVTEAWFNRDCDDVWDDLSSYGEGYDYSTRKIPFDTPYPPTWEGAPHPGEFDDWVLPDWARYADVDPQDGYLSLWEIKAKTWTVDDNNPANTAELDPGEVYVWRLKFKLDPEVKNEFQAQGVEVTVTFTLNQK